MNLSKKTGRALVLILQATLLAGTPMAVQATEHTLVDETYTYTDITSLGITKVVTADGDTYQPDTSFYYGVESGEAEAEEDVASSDGVVIETIYAGVEGGLNVVSDDEAPAGYGSTITFCPSAGDLLDTSYSGSSQLVIDPSVFSSTGVYRYVLTEYQPSEEQAYEGINYDATVYHIYLYVYQDGDTGEYFVGNVVATIVEGDTETKVGSTNSEGDSEEDGLSPDDNLYAAGITFTNDYGGTLDSTHDVTVTNQVSGNMGDKKQSFHYKVTVSSSEGEESGEMYKVVWAVDDTSAEITTYLLNTVTGSFTISHTGYIRIYGLTDTDEITVVEEDYSEEGYTTTAQYNDTEQSLIPQVYEGDTAGNAISVTAQEDGSKLVVTNTKSAAVPTGVFFDVLPFLALLAAAVLMSFINLWGGRRGHKNRKGGRHA